MAYRTTTYAILGILAIHSDLSGYEIRRIIQQSVGFFWGESYGQIYPTLRRLAAEGLIAEEPSTAPGARKRRAYSITPAGRRLLTEWLAAPYRIDPPRDEFLMKLFFGIEAAPAVSIAHIERFQQDHRQLLSTLIELEKLVRAHNSGHPGFPFWMLTLNYGLAQIRAALEWSESALATLNAMNPGEESASHAAD